MTNTLLPRTHEGHADGAYRRSAMRTARAAWWCTTVCLLVIATTPMVEAQVLASSFDQLQVLVKPGDTVRVTDGTGVEARGTIGALSPSSLEMVIEGNRRIFSENDVRTIRQRRGDSLRNGAWWGFGIMAGLALLSAGGGSLPTMTTQGRWRWPCSPPEVSVRQSESAWMR